MRVAKIYTHSLQKAIGREFVRYYETSKEECIQELRSLQVEALNSHKPTGNREPAQPRQNADDRDSVAAQQRVEHSTDLSQTLQQLLCAEEEERSDGEDFIDTNYLEEIRSSLHPPQAMTAETLQDKANNLPGEYSAWTELIDGVQNLPSEAKLFSGFSIVLPYAARMLRARRIGTCFSADGCHGCGPQKGTYYFITGLDANRHIVSLVSMKSKANPSYRYR